MSVAIPVRDGGELFAGVLDALAAQTVGHELLVCDSGSADGSRELAASRGARVIDVRPEQFTHGGVRNTLMDAARGEYVALLTQDGEPADERWLERLLEGFTLAGDVAMAFGPYRPRPHASVPVRLELERWFASLSPDGQPVVDRLDENERLLPVRQLLGRRGFYTDANACLRRSAWQQVPFREVPYAEDRLLAIDMLRAGYAKAFLPMAAVVHSHDYSSGQQLRRCFDEWRGLLEVYGWREPVSPLRVGGQLRGALGAARDQLVREALPSSQRRAALAAVARHHVLCRAGALLGSHADRLPAAVRRALSLEGRASVQPLHLDGEHAAPVPDGALLR